MKLSRRDALVALGASGLAVGGGVLVLGWDDVTADEEVPLGHHDVATLETFATVLYPSEVENVPAFLETYVGAKLDARPDRAEAIAAALATLDEYCESWWGAPLVDLPPETRQDVPEQMGLARVEPVPDGHEIERVRYYLVNDLLLALYSSPTGGELLGIENPPGYPGGQASYQRGPGRE